MLRLDRVLLLLLAFALARASFSQDRWQWEFSGFGGGSFLGGGDFPTPVTVGGQETSRTVGLSYASGYVVGARISERFGEAWRANLEYGFANQPMRMTNLLPAVPSLRLGHAVHQFTYNISYFPPLPTRRFYPFASVGAGPTLYYIKQSSKAEARMLGLDLDDTWKFMFNWG